MLQLSLSPSAFSASIDQSLIHPPSYEPYPSLSELKTIHVPHTGLLNRTSTQPTTSLNTTSQPSVSIIGAGPAGFALAADLARHGVNILLYSHPDHQRHAKHVIENGVLKINGLIQGSTNLHVTIDMAEAIAFSSTIILTVPSTGQETVLHEWAHYDLSQHTVIAIPGNLFSLVASSTVRIGHVLETNLSPYSCRMTSPGEVSVLGRKTKFFIGGNHALPNNMRQTVQAIFPMTLQWRANIVEVCLSNINGVFHPLMMLMNAGRIESTGGDFLLYRDGLTRSVARAIEAVDRVRVAIGRAFGFNMRSVVEVSNECYGQNFGSLVDLARHSPPHNTLRAPANIENRNISEDVPDLLVCWHGLAETLGIEAAPLMAVIVLAEMATEVPYLEKGRNLRLLNLEGISRSELLRRFSVPSK